VRICYVSHSGWHPTRPHVEYFSKSSHEVHLISLPQADVAGVVNHHPLKSGFDPQNNKLAYLRALPKVYQIIRRINPDIVHAHYVTSNGMLAAFANCHPLIVSARGSDVYS